MGGRSRPVAALLSASADLEGWDNPPFSEEWVKGAVRYAYVFGEWESVKGELEDLIAP